MSFDDMRNQMIQVLQTLQTELRRIFLAVRKDETAFCDELTDPWAEVECWVQELSIFKQKYNYTYSPYKLSNNQIGIQFFDDTQLVVMPGDPDITYLGHKHKTKTPVKEKLDILYDFLESVNESCLGKRGRDIEWSETEAPKEVTFLYEYMIDDVDIIIYYLTNGTVQVDIDNEKIVVSTEKSAITYIDKKMYKRTFTFQTLQEKICCAGMEKHLLKVYEMIGKFLIQAMRVFRYPYFPFCELRYHG